MILTVKCHVFHRSYNSLNKLYLLQAGCHEYVFLYQGETCPSVENCCYNSKFFRFNQYICQHLVAFLHKEFDFFELENFVNRYTRYSGVYIFTVLPSYVLFAFCC